MCISLMLVETWLALGSVLTTIPHHILMQYSVRVVHLNQLIATKATWTHLCTGALTFLPFHRVQNVFEGVVTSSDSNLLGCYPMAGWGDGTASGVYAIAGSNQVTGVLVGTATWQSTAHNICLCNGRVFDSHNYCIGQTNACQSYCTSKYWGVDCLSCNHGYYLASGDCTACPAGKYSGVTGATSSATCTTCPAVITPSPATVRARGAHLAPTQAPPDPPRVRAVLLTSVLVVALAVVCLAVHTL